MPKSKYKTEDRVKFVSHGPMFGSLGKVLHVRKDGHLIVHFDKHPEGSAVFVDLTDVAPEHPLAARSKDEQPRAVKKSTTEIKRDIAEFLASAKVRKLTKSEQKILDQVRYANELGALAGLSGDDKFVMRLAAAGDIVYVDRAHVGRGRGWVAKDGALASLIGAP